MKMWSEANEEIRMKMRKELNEDPERMENHVRLLAEWIASKPYMPKNYDKALLTSFLRFSKQDLQRAKKKLEAFFALVTYNQSVFGNIKLEFEQRIADYRTIFDIYVSPELSPDGHRLTIGRVKETAAKEGFAINFYKLVYFQECLKFFQGASRLGDDYVIDIRHFTASMLPRIATAGVFQCGSHFQHTFPVRYRRIICTNMNAVMSQFLNLAKPILGRKMRERISYRADGDLTDIYPRAMLPQEFGGDLAPMHVLCDEYMTTLRANADRIAAVEQCKLRGRIPEEYKCKFDGGFGIDGSFRKLDLD